MDNQEVKDNNKNYDLLFKKSEDGSEKFDELVFDLLYTSDGTMKDIERAKKDLKFIYGYEKDYVSYKILDDLIHDITDLNTEESQESLIRKIGLLDIVKNVSKDGDNYKIETIDGIIIFSPIGFNNDIDAEINDLLTESNEVFKESLRHGDWRIYLKQISTVHTRMGECHPFAVDASRMLRDYFGIENSVVTGYTFYATEKSKYLHSWNEFKTSDGQEFVLDSTFNVIMNKEGYYLLRHVEPISRIDSRTITEDRKKYGSFLDDIDLKTYLTCRDEIIKDLEKNKQIFQDDER